MQYDEIPLTFTAESVSLCCVCSRLWSVCEVVVVPYVDAVVAVTVMRVLLFVLHVCMLRVLWMSGVRGMRRVGGVREMCMCLARGLRWWRGGLVDDRIGFGLCQFCRNRWGVGRVSVFGLRWCGWCRWVGGLDQGLEGWCYVCVSCESGLSV